MAYDAIAGANEASAHERDEAAEWPELPAWRLYLEYGGTTRDGFVRARWERRVGIGPKARHELVCSGRGADANDLSGAVAALRENLKELRRRRALHRPMGAWSTDREVGYAD